MITLEMIDQVRERAAVSYKEAKDALELTNGDVLEAIIHLETRKQKGFGVNVTEMSNEVIENLKALIQKGNVTRILLEKEGKPALDIPIVAGAIGAVFFAPATISGILAALVVGYQLKIVKDDGEVIDINDMAEDTLQNVKNRVDEIKNRLSKKDSCCGDNAEEDSCDCEECDCEDCDDEDIEVEITEIKSEEDKQE